MVEFGLKLEDNKVAEWSNKYIDYEKLKSILKRAKAAAEHREELIKRNDPVVVSEVVKERDAKYAAARREALMARSKSGLEEVDGEEEDDNKYDDESSALEMTSPWSSEHHANSRSGDKNQCSDSLATESTPLLAETSLDEVSGQNSFKGIKRISSMTQLHHAVFKVTSYLGLADDKSLLMRALLDADEKLVVFKKAYEGEVKKVDDFYHEQLDDISQRMEALIESVDTSQFKPPKKKVKRGSTLVGAMKERFEAMMHGHALSSSSSVLGQNFSDKDLFAMDEVHLSLSDDADDLDWDTDPERRMKNRSFGDDKYGKQSSGKEGRRKEEMRRAKLDLVRESDSIKRAIADIYRTAKLLHNFSIMNYTGFIKIAKKFDKTFPDHKGTFKRIICDDEKQAEMLTARMERLYARWFCDGEIREAQAQLLSKRGDGLMMDWTQLRLGYRLGMCSILALWVAWDCVWGQFAKGEVSIGGRTAFPVFRGCFGLLAWHWFWGMSVYVWTRFRINYIYLFDFDPRLVDTPIDIFNDAVDETLVFFLCMLMYYKAGANDMPQWVPPGAYPMFLVLYTIKSLVFPWKIRKPLWMAIRQVLMSPLVSPTFFLTYVGDVFTSMVKVFQDLLWTACFVLSGDWLLSEAKHETSSRVHIWTESLLYKNIAIPLICLLPLWLRFNQCLRRYLDTGKRYPNLANAFKYAMSQSVTLFGAFHPLYLMHVQEEEKTISLVEDDDQDVENLIMATSRHSNLFQIFWMGLFIASSLYSFWWDVYMDWGLGRREDGFLGPRLMFPRRSYYFMVISADLVLRFMWVLTLIPPQSGAQFELPAYLSAISMTVELFRRTIWSFFRLEHEHRQNTEGFRRVNVVPLHFNTGHKHKYNERHWVGWKVLVEIVIVTSIVIAISAFSVIAAQRATHEVQLAHEAMSKADYL